MIIFYKENFIYIAECILLKVIRQEWILVFKAKNKFTLQYWTLATRWRQVVIFRIAFGQKGFFMNKGVVCHTCKDISGVSAPLVMSLLVESFSGTVAIL